MTFSNIDQFNSLVFFWKISISSRFLTTSIKSLIIFFYNYILMDTLAFQMNMPVWEKREGHGDNARGSK